MTEVPLWLVPAVPMILVLALCIPGFRPYVRFLVPLAPLPALMAGLADPGPTPLRLEWLLLGTDLAVTRTAATFLVFTSILWSLAGWQLIRLLKRDTAQTRTFLCFLIAMTGNLGLLIAQDMAAFYTFFAMMSLASWGLVLHGGGIAQTFAGRVYIVFAVAGEIALFAGLAVGHSATGELRLAAMAAEAVPLIATALVSLGFLIKLGAVPLHIWLPLAHAAAPAPASAVLSGAMLKAGLFGLMTVLPLGQTALPDVAVVFAAMALAGFVLAPVLGLVQEDPKAVLAYSSIGQMSLIALGLAAALAEPATWILIAPALVMLATYHAFSKAALFLGVPVIWSVDRGASRIAVLVVMALPALALAGMPGTSGWLAKGALKTALEGAPVGWTIWIGTALFAASLGTTLLMLRAFFLLAGAPHKPDTARGVALPWLVMTAMVMFGLSVAHIAPDVAKAASLADLLPIVTAGILAGLGGVIFHYAGLRLQPATPGELLGLVRHVSQPKPIPTPTPPNRTNRFVIRRAADALLRPDRGALAILTMVVALALFMALVTPPAPLEPSQPVVEVTE